MTRTTSRQKKVPGVTLWLPWPPAYVYPSLCVCVCLLEVLEYCKVLDLDPVAERELLYIAREGIKAPLPKDWKPV